MSRRTVEGKWFVIDFIEEWSQFFDACNWRTFRFVHIEVEDENHLGNAEFTVVILGLGCRVSWTYNDNTEDRRELEARIASICDETDVQ